MSLNNDTTFRRRGRSQRRAAVQVDRRRDSAGRGFQHRRQIISPGSPIFGGDGDGDGDAVTTITQVRTISSATTSKRSTTTRSSTTITSKTSIKTTSSSSSSTSSLETQPETTFSLPGQPLTTSSPVSSLPNGSPTATSADSNSTNPAQGVQGGLSSGAIAGIAIAVVVVLAALIAFLVRRRMMASRAEKRTDWLDRSGFAQPSIMAQSNFASQPSARPPPPAPEPYGYGSPRLSYSQPVPPPPPVPSDPYPPPPPPPLAPFATSSRPASLIPGRGGTESPVPSSVPFQSSAVPIPVPVVPPPPVTAPPSVPLPSNALTVRCTFVPSMADELSISTGETIQVLQEYDDGWALCLNRQGQQGMVPMECLEVSSASGVAVGAPGLNRSSSLSGRS